MNLFILADMEGASGIYKQEHFTVGAEGWEKWGKLCLTEDICALAEGAHRAGSKKITLRDYHAGGFNVFPERLPKSVKPVMGQHIRPIPVIGDQPEMDMAFLAAQHVSQDAPGAFYPHTFHLHVKNIEVNGKTVSEAELLAGVLGEAMKTPVGLISGDPVLLNRLEPIFSWAELIPCSKNPEDLESAEKREETIRKERKELFEAAQRAVKRRAEMKIFRFEGPIAMKIELHFPESPITKNSWGFKRSSDTGFCIERENFPDAYMDLFKLLFIPKRLYPLATLFLPILNRFFHPSIHQFLRRSIVWR